MGNGDARQHPRGRVTASGAHTLALTLRLGAGAGAEPGSAALPRPTGSRHGVRAACRRQVRRGRLPEGRRRRCWIGAWVLLPVPLRLVAAAFPQPPRETPYLKPPGSHSGSAGVHYLCNRGASSLGRFPLGKRRGDSGGAAVEGGDGERLDRHREALFSPAVAGAS